MELGRIRALFMLRVIHRALRAAPLDNLETTVRELRRYFCWFSHTLAESERTSISRRFGATRGRTIQTKVSLVVAKLFVARPLPAQSMTVRLTILPTSGKVHIG